MEKINFYTQSSLDETPELRMVIDVSGNVGIGESNPTKTLEVAGDISFNGNLYQNGSLFVGGGGGGLTDLSATSINDLSDVSLNGIQVNQTLKWDGEKLVPTTLATTDTKQGQVLETLVGVCDGRTVVVESGTYTLANITQGTLISGSTSNFIDFPGSSISYKPPQGTKLVCYTFQFSTGRNDNDSSLGYKFLIDNTEITSFKRYDGMSGDYGEGFKTVHYVIEVGETDDIPNGKLSSWNNLKTIKLQVATEPNYNFWINKSYYDIQQGQTVPSPVISLPSAISLINHDGSAHSRDRGDLSKIIDSDDNTFSYTTVSYTNNSHGPFIIKMDFPSSLIGSTLTQLLFKHSSTESYTINAKFGILNGSTYTSLNVVSGINLGSGTTLNTGTVATWNNDTDWHIENYPYSQATEITVSNYVIQTNDKLVFRWTNNQTNKHWPLYYVKINTGSVNTNNPNNSSSTYVKKPILKITAIGESAGQAVTLTNNSVSDLSDISFNSTSTTDGQALVWNSTDAVWEAGAVASSGGVSSGDDISFNNLDISGVLRGTSGYNNNQLSLESHIIPTSNASFDLGNAEYKIRHLFLSDNSLWVGENHKIEISNGKMKFRKIQKDTLPSGLSGITGASLEDAVAVLGKTPGSNASTFSLADWEAYSKVKGTPLKVDDIFQLADMNDEAVTLTNNSVNDLSDVSFNSTTITQGNSLIWNNTDKVWEAGAPTTSIVNTTTVTNGGGWANLNATNTPAYDFFGDIVYDGNDSFYFVGGRENSSTTRNYVWKYTISTNAWSQVTTTGVTMHNVLEHGLVFYNNALYVFAGYVNGANVNTLHKLDLTQSTPTWSLVSTSGTTPSARRDICVTMYNSKLIVFAGYSNAVLNDLYEIDLASGTPTWNQLHNGSGTAPSGRFGSMIEAYQDKIIIFSGGGQSDQELWEYDLTNNTWSQKTSTGSTPSYRIWPQHTIVGDKIYMYGGYPNLKNDFYSLDVTTYNWTQITSNITLQGMSGHGVSYANGKIYLYGNNASTTGYTYEYTIPITTTTYNPVEINKLSTYYALSVGPNYDTSNMDNSGNLIVEGNVGIGLSDPSGYKLEVAGDISFNGNLYQNGSVFTGGSTIDETTDVSLNNLDIYGDISAASNMIIQGKIEMGSNDYFSAYQAELHGWNRYGGSRIYSVNYDANKLYDTTSGYLTGNGESSFLAYRDGGSTSYTINGRSSMSNVKSFFYYGMDNSTNLTIGGINPTQTQLQSTGYKYTFELRNFYDPNTYARYPKHFVIAGRTTTISNNSNYSSMTSSSDAVLDDWTFICEYQYTGTNSDSASYTNNPHFFNPGTNHTLTNCSFVEAGQNAIDINGRASRGYNGRNTEYHIIETTNTSLPLYSGFAMFILDNTAGYTQLRSWNINIEHTQQITTVSKISLETEGIIIGGKSSSNLIQGYNLDVSGNGIFSGTVTANGSVLSSDDRIKHNEEPITNALSTISKLKPKHYFKTTSLYDESHHFRVNNNNEPINIFSKPLVINKDYTIETGIIAQELLDIPELKFAVQNTTPLGVDYNSIHCTHIAATNELHQLVKSQQTELEQQQEEIENLKLVNQDLNNQFNNFIKELQDIKQHLGI